MSGTREVVDVATGDVNPIGPGTLYARDPRSPHPARPHTDLTLVCVFTPALSGNERHDADGSYEPTRD